MSKEELKEIIHKKVDEIQDKEFLNALVDFLKVKKDFEISDYRLNRIKEAAQQIKEGKSFSNEEADKLVEEWLKK